MPRRMLAFAALVPSSSREQRDRRILRGVQTKSAQIFAHSRTNWRFWSSDIILTRERDGWNRIFKTTKNQIWNLIFLKFALWVRTIFVGGHSVHPYFLQKLVWFYSRRAQEIKVNCLLRQERVFGCAVVPRSEQRELWGLPTTFSSKK